LLFLLWKEAGSITNSNGVLGAALGWDHDCVGLGICKQRLLKDCSRDGNPDWDGESRKISMMRRQSRIALIHLSKYTYALRCSTRLSTPIFISSYLSSSVVSESPLTPVVLPACDYPDTIFWTAFMRLPGIVPCSYNL
jgi:hypothetical protein